MSEIAIAAIRCADRLPTDGRFGGYDSWERLAVAMKAQKKRPFAKRLRPCLKHDDWWIVQAQACVGCTEGTWELSIGGERMLAKVRSVAAGKTELAVAGTGEILYWSAKRGFE